MMKSLGWSALFTFALALGVVFGDFFSQGSRDARRLQADLDFSEGRVVALQRELDVARVEVQFAAPCRIIPSVDEDIAGRRLIQFQHAYNVKPFCGTTAAASTTALEIGWACVQ